MARRFLPLALLGILSLGGCHMPVQQNVDALICGRANRPLDLPTSPTEFPLSSGTPLPTDGLPTSPSSNDGGSGGGLQQTSAQILPIPKNVQVTTLEQRLSVPKGLPGGNVERIVLPPSTDELAYNRAMAKYFPPLPQVDKEFQPAPGPNGQPYTLAELQKMAVAHNPQLRQAATNIEAAKGAVVTAGQYPNPVVGPSASSTPGPSGGPLYGGGISQLIMGFGKLRAAEAAALMDLENAKLAYRRAETDLMASVRGSYFAVLVAQENIRANRALVELTDEVYKVLVQQAKGGIVATYEPMQVAVFAIQARAGLITARNSYTLAWKLLATNIGLAALPPTQLVGQIDMPIPLYRYDAILAHVLTNHTDVKTAEVGITKARYNLRLAELQPVPDVTLSANVIHDNTPTLGTFTNWRVISSGIQLGVPIPVWHQNRGGIWQSQGGLMRAIEEPHRVRNDLTARVADAFRRYDENKSLVELYVREALPKQVQAFRAAVKRHYGGGEAAAPAFSDLISSEQNLVSVVGQYITVLGLQWQAVVDVASLVQTDDLFQRVEQFQVAEIPNLQELLKMPCCHPCGEERDPALKGAILHWPQAGLLPEATGQLPPPTSQLPPAPKNTPKKQEEVSLPLTTETPFVFVMPDPSTPTLVAAPTEAPAPLVSTLSAPRP